MRRGLILLAAAAALSLASLAGCDDETADKPVKAEKHVASSLPARLGAGWRATTEDKVSAWGFSNGQGPAGDPVENIRSAIEAGTLPPKASVRIAALVEHFAVDLPAPASGEPPFRAIVALTVTPWNDETLLLWVGVVGGGAPGAFIPRDLANAPDRPGITVEFDPTTISAYRPAGNPAALDAGEGIPAAAAIYELSPLRDVEHDPQGQLAVLHIRYRIPGAPDAGIHELVRPITGADLVESIDDAPEAARFAAAVVGFGGLLQGDPAVRDLSCSEAIRLAESAIGADPDDPRARFVALMRRAEPLIDQPPPDAAQAGDAPH